MVKSILLIIMWVLSHQLCAQDDRFTRQFIDDYCLPCHSKAKHKGDTVLEQMLSPGVTTDNDHLWESVRRALAEQTMPPVDKKQPGLHDRDLVIRWIDRALDGPNGDTPTDPGWTTVRRLTRLEYNRTLHDLLGVDGDPAGALPADNSGGNGSFDNQADTLYVSPLLMERLLEVSTDVIAKAKPGFLPLIQPEPDRHGTISTTARRKAIEASLEEFLPKAWRRPVERQEIAKLYKIYDRAFRKENATHEQALKLTYAAALTSPNFLFRIEKSQPGTAPYQLNGYEIATRLSYFLWSTMPDQALFAAAADGSLDKTDGISKQIARMLADPKGELLSKQFIGQWLGTAELAHGLGPDSTLISGYTESLRAAMIHEPVIFFHSLLTDNRPLTDLIDCDYVYVNETLARHYDIKGVTGSDWRKHNITDGRRGGLITMGGVLAITSRPSRTSPVIRGKWILQELLSYPPPPPPPNVPSLPEDSDGKPAEGTLRQRLEIHRTDPKCNSCHQRIDPLGFGLENYDAIGRWRTRGPHGEALDTIGTMPGGETFDGPQQLKALLKQRQERIMQTVVERLLIYALGRDLERHDRSTVRQICNRLKEDGYQAQTLIREIVLSLPFRYKRNPIDASAPPPGSAP